MHFTRFKTLSILLICLAGFLVAMPNFFSKETVQSWPSFMPKKQLRLGLDLQGGAHLLLAMDEDELKKDWINNLRDEARKVLRDAKIGFTGIGAQGLSQLVIKLAKPEQRDAAMKALHKVRQPIGNALLGSSAYDVDLSEGSDPGTIIIKESEQGLRQRIANAASASIETINRRVNNLGTSESTIVRQGTDRILVQFPGLKDTKELKKLIGETAKLTFHEVHPSLTTEEAKMTSIPSGYKIYQGDKGENEYLLREQPVVQGADLADAQPGFDSRTGEPVINFRFNQIGARRFAAFTKDHVGRPFAIVLDDKVLSAPVIREPILGGSGQISGNFTVESTNRLAVQLRSGSLPTKLTIVEERTVGPSLGADSIAAGKLAGIIGGLAVVCLTILAYGTFGIFACVGLVVHLMLTLALMTLIGSTLTLPGIAGLVLGVAMAVDANVLIYERIREELRVGKMPVSAIDAGFNRAFVTIADSQLTTLACAIIMFWLGAGPIRGFAVTLTIGILTSIFASVTVVRLLISLWLKAQPKGRIATVPV
ncbi:protein translocase subunit SecD [Hyphomicrobium sp.]|jgi:preprotein translocase subunit SecD|uniref:protein translocase subunit SecD n=1 Tax=Hyphomicrobium sp. TaxID=82 RepID=UPI002C8F3137|nr:protein translocase subunit SecD [Hyphomicrobium sp.]HVZ04272.1 protein translocase subunit SecD [Hyphomicrobium sp.]